MVHHVRSLKGHVSFPVITHAWNHSSPEWSQLFTFCVSVFRLTRMTGEKIPHEHTVPPWNPTLRKSSTGQPSPNRIQQFFSHWLAYTTLSDLLQSPLWHLIPTHPLPHAQHLISPPSSSGNKKLSDKNCLSFPGTRLFTHSVFIKYHEKPGLWDQITYVFSLVLSLW